MRARARLWILIGLTAIVSSAVLGFVAAQLLKSAVRETTVSRLQKEVDLLAATGARVTPPAAPSVAADTARRLGVRVTLIAADGTVVADSTLDDAELVARMDNHRSRPEIVGAERNGTGESRRVSSTTGVEYYYLAQRFSGGNGFARVALPSADLEAYEDRYLWWLVVAIIGALFAVGAVARILVGRFSRPLEQLTSHVERVADGDFELEIPTAGGRELGRLSSSVDRMRQVLSSKLVELREEKKLLASVTDGMAEGLLLVGADRRVLLVNSAFERIFRIRAQAKGHLIGETLRHPVVVDEIDETLQTGEDQREAVSGIPGSNRSFELHTTSVAIPGSMGKPGVLAMFFDITRLEALERVRRQFVADVTHELRTPLTSINASIETLLEGGIDDAAVARRFLAIAQRQSARMGDLVADLTDLSQIETGAVILDVRTFEFEPLAREVVTSVTTRHRDRQVDVAVDVSAGQTVHADRRRLEQVLVNLVDNAVKYSPDGSQVTVQARRVEGGTEVSVSDNGPGIPEDCHDKVFQRFFRLDKARTREAGGTGLGLAIVKHLMKLHHGTVRVDSELGKGSRFVLDFPESSLS